MGSIFSSNGESNNMLLILMLLLLTKSDNGESGAGASITGLTDGLGGDNLTLMILLLLLFKET